MDECRDYINGEPMANRHESNGQRQMQLAAPSSTGTPLTDTLSLSAGSLARMKPQYVRSLESLIDESVLKTRGYVPTL